MVISRTFNLLCESHKLFLLNMKQMNRLFKPQEKWLLKMKNESIKRILPKWLTEKKNVSILSNPRKKKVIRDKKKYIL